MQLMLAAAAHGRRGRASTPVRSAAATATAVLLLAPALSLAKLQRTAFSFEPGAPLEDQAYFNSSLNSWGGSPIAVGSKYHLFMSALTGSLNHWSTQSYIARAVADAPEGPYRLAQSSVLPVFHHNPAIVRAPDGTFLLFSIGPSVFSVELHFSDAVDGPWRSLGLIINGSNPSPAVLPNGTVVVAYKGKPNGLRIVTAAHWRGPYRPVVNGHGSQLLLAAADVGCYIEDYDIWFDREQGRWYSLTHQYNFTMGRRLLPGGLLFTEGDDLSGPWHLSPIPAYDYNPLLTGQHDPLTLIHRERPKRLIVGNRTYLFNGAALAPAHGQSGYGKTFTLVQQVASWTPPNGFND